jgi:hypothetical protein
MPLFGGGYLWYSLREVVCGKERGVENPEEEETENDLRQ